MNINERIAEIEALNEKAKKLNYERQRCLGAVEESKKRYEDGVKTYAQKYGVVLDATNLNTEYAKVQAAVEEQAKALEQQIEYIESGAYKAQQTATPVTATSSTGEDVGTPAGVNVPNAAVNSAMANAIANAPVSNGNNAGGVAANQVGNFNPAPESAVNGVSAAPVNTGFGTPVGQPFGATGFGFPAQPVPSQPMAQPTPVVPTPVGFGTPANAVAANAQMAGILNNN